jgi:shikimate dehydrogenase
MTDRYALIGNPVHHSKSPLIHSSFAAASGQDISYVTIEAPVNVANGFADMAQAFRVSGGKGLNITAPFKLDAYAYATEHSERAQRAGAVNAIKFDGSRILADNYDGLGLVNDIQRNLQTPVAGRRVLLLGAGGAARGAILPLLECKPALLVVANRTPAKAHELIKTYEGETSLQAGSYEDLAGEHFDIVINATSASLRAETPAISPKVFAPEALAYEMVYGKGLTPFLKLAQGAGVQRLADGVGMLVEQAVEAFVWWRGVRPDTKAMIKQLTVPLV